MKTKTIFNTFFFFLIKQNKFTYQIRHLTHTHAHPHTEQIKGVLKAYHERIRDLEDKKYDIEYIVKRKDVEV